MAAPLNDIQLEILKLFREEQSDEELQEIRSLLVTYLSDKVVREADKAFDDASYDPVAIVEQWKLEHFRKGA